MKKKFHWNGHDKLTDKTKLLNCRYFIKYFCRSFREHERPSNIEKGSATASAWSPFTCGCVTCRVMLKSIGTSFAFSLSWARLTLSNHCSTIVWPIKYLVQPAKNVSLALASTTCRFLNPSLASPPGLGLRCPGVLSFFQQGKIYAVTTANDKFHFTFVERNSKCDISLKLLISPRRDQKLFYIVQVFIHYWLLFDAAISFQNVG